MVLMAVFCIAAMFDPAEVSAGEFDYQGQHWLSLNTVPTDSAQAEQRRVWLPLERQNSCLTKVTIRDQSGKEIRAVYEAQLGGGYHNLYWDKRDNFGRWVPAGDYTCKIEDCNINKDSKITASYAEGETDLLLFASRTEGILAVEFDLFKDSLPVSISILNMRGRKIETIFSDSLMTKGRHHFDWSPKKRIAKGYFQIQVAASGFDHSVFVHHLKK